MSLSPRSLHIKHAWGACVPVFIACMWEKPARPPPQIDAARFRQPHRLGALPRQRLGPLVRQASSPAPARFPQGGLLCLSHFSSHNTQAHIRTHTHTYTHTYTTCVHARTPLQKYRGECSLFACEPVAQVICCVQCHGRRICACLWPAIRDRQARAGIASPWRCAHAQGATHPVQLNPHGGSSRGGRRILCRVTLSRAEA